MNAAQRKEYWRKVERLRAQLDAKYFEQVRNSIIAQFKRFARDIEAIGVDAARSRLGLDLWDKEMLKIFEAMYKESVVLFGNSVYRALKIEANQKAETFGFNREWTDAVLEFLLKQGFVLVADITSTTKKKLLDIVSKGIEEGMGVDEIVRIITSDEQLAYATFRARRIVRTEVMRSSNIGAMKGAEAHPFVVDKEWISARDSRTRRIPQDEFDHVELDGVIVGFDEFFTSTGKQGEQVAVQQPGQLDNKNEGVYAPAGFTINCRCTVAFIPKRDANGRLVMKPKVNAPQPTPNISIPNRTNPNITNVNNIVKPSTKQEIINKINSLTNSGVSDLDKLDERVLNGILESLQSETYFKFDRAEYRTDRQTVMAATKEFGLLIGTQSEIPLLNRSIGLQLLDPKRRNYSAAGQLLQGKDLDGDKLISTYSKYITDHELNHIKHYSVEYAALGGWGKDLERLSKSWLKKWDDAIMNYSGDWVVSDYANSYRDKRKSYEWLAESYLLYNNKRELIKDKKILQLLDEFDDILNKMRNAK